MHKTDCMAYCDCENAKMVDADIVTQSKTYFLEYSHVELYLHLNVLFDYNQKKWINEISEAELDNNLWFKKDRIICDENSVCTGPLFKPFQSVVMIIENDTMIVVRRDEIYFYRENIFKKKYPDPFVAKCFCWIDDEKDLPDKQLPNWYLQNKFLYVYIISGSVLIVSIGYICSSLCKKNR